MRMEIWYLNARGFDKSFIAVASNSYNNAIDRYKILMDVLYGVWVDRSKGIYIQTSNNTITFDNWSYYWGRSIG